MWIWGMGENLGMGERGGRKWEFLLFQVWISSFAMANCWLDSLMVLEISIFEYITKTFTALTGRGEQWVIYMEVNFIPKVSHKANSAHLLKLLTVLI